MLLNYLAIWLFIINALSYILFALDKKYAKAQSRRIPEKTLHICTLLGGSLGAWLAIVSLRHKNRKFAFWGITFLITVLHIGILYVLRSELLNLLNTNP